MPIQLSDATVLANNEAVGIVPNSLTYTEGFGEQQVRVAALGGGKTEQIYAQDVEGNMSTLKFELPTTVENIKLARKWKANQNQNVFTIAGSTSDGDMTKTFTQAAVTNDYEVAIGTEGSIEIEIMANAAV
jgi:hypothetical protein